MVQTESYTHIQEVSLQNAPQASLSGTMQKDPGKAWETGEDKEKWGAERGGWRRVGN